MDIWSAYERAINKYCKNLHRLPKYSVAKMGGAFASNFRFRVRDVMSDVTDSRRREWLQQ